MSLDPDCKRVHELYALANRPPLETLTPAEAREGYRRATTILASDPVDVGEVRDLAATGPAGAIPLRLYRPKGANPQAPLPALVFFHGGGWTIGDFDTHDAVCRALCAESGVAVLAVDYRMAPEHRFPAAAEDAYAATAWIAANSKTLAIDPTRLAVGGDSAGGNLSAVVALMARDKGGPALKLQVLIYPAVDFTMSAKSFETNGDVLPLTRAAVVWFRDHYLGPDLEIVGRDWRASPIFADLKGLPPAYVVTAGYDVLCDEGKAYADKLETAGVSVERAHFPGMIHGFVTMGKYVQAAQTALSDCANAIKRALT
ncbi:MAG: alpha/beta hydrolase [Hyphomicrobiales bacterium]|nr:MAG: alpha/beta hydrolase [Hyphomicrobiales bacterium]